MTGFARKELAESWGNVVCEIRSVNLRHLETQFRLNDELRGLEPLLRDKLRQSIARGKVECQINLELDQQATGELNINKPLAKKVIDAAKWINKASGEGVINPMDVLNWPGVIVPNTQDLDLINQKVLILFDETLNAFIAMRQREGEQIRAILEQKLTGITNEIDLVRALMPVAIKWQRDRLISKFEDINLQPDTTRLEQELLLLANKVDVAEELDRLVIHIKEAYAILNKPEAIGRRLDFMMQEFNREANTLGSKAINAKITQSAIEIKILIEQMREQIQNIE